ncbi:MAG: electron transfer flavoprotein subunit alpha/FixB family protein [Candidatus Eisenbacteria bacterium]|uniref:Electron transfer flavoprotein subunit alpha/FixB family protein n=1 Tax=Eiseniibacteriota bacterium TaxID=2212470 RepID=A0A7Y2E7E7_UNCEI|nr:electron transfer flavoprotein subunit alpha/FixB family protein [Candidatus Eisenbacteria bacterium]
MANEVLLFVEQRNGEIKKSSLEALGAAKAIATSKGGSLGAVVAGEGISGLAETLGSHGADVVYMADHGDMAHYSTEGYAHAVTQALDKSGATILVGSATAMGKDLAPRLAARKDWAFLADTTSVAIEGDKLVVTRPEYAGKVISKLATAATGVVLTLRPNSFSVPEASGGSAQVETLDVSGANIRAKVVALETKEQGLVDVAEADRVVSGGRGLKEAENFSLVFDLAKELGAGVGASRAVVDAGWIGHDHQVGQTGKTVSPNLYIACGISGAIQHLAGMRTSKCIVAINKDAEAPIFQVADYGIVGDVFEVLPKLTDAVKALNS